MKRYANSNKSSQRQFSRSASRSHAKNFSSGPMRGGIRL